MIRHIVLTKFKPETPETKIAKIYDDLSMMVENLPGARNFTGGRSQSPENIERGYMHGFVIDFDSWDALERYANNEAHKLFASRLIANAEGGGDGILVVDLDVEG